MAWKIYRNKFVINGIVFQSSYSESLTNADILQLLSERGGMVRLNHDLGTIEAGSSWFSCEPDDPDSEDPYSEIIWTDTMTIRKTSYYNAAGVVFHNKIGNYWFEWGLIVSSGPTTPVKSQKSVYAFICVNEDTKEMVFVANQLNDNYLWGCDNRFTTTERKAFYQFIKAGEISEPTSSTLYIGDPNGICRNVPKLCYGDPNGIARKCKLFYGDPNGIARLIIGEGGEPLYPVDAETLGYAQKLWNIMLTKDDSWSAYYKQTYEIFVKDFADVCSGAVIHPSSPVTQFATLNDAVYPAIGSNDYYYLLKARGDNELRFVYKPSDNTASFYRKVSGVWQVVSNNYQANEILTGYANWGSPQIRCNNGASISATKVVTGIIYGYSISADYWNGFNSNLKWSAGSLKNALHWLVGTCNKVQVWVGETFDTALPVMNYPTSI